MLRITRLRSPSLRDARRWALAVAAFACVGCVPYPVIKTLQPATEVRVSDNAGQPLPGADVSLIATMYPMHLEHHRETRQTDAQGLVQFDSRHDLRVESLMLHGSVEFYWNLCITQPGYATVETRYGASHAWPTQFVFAMQPGDSTPCRDTRKMSGQR